MLVRFGAGRQLGLWGTCTCMLPTGEGGIVSARINAQKKTSPPKDILGTREAI